MFTKSSPWAVGWGAERNFFGPLGPGSFPTTTTLRIPRGGPPFNRGLGARAGPPAKGVARAVTGLGKNVGPQANKPFCSFVFGVPLGDRPCPALAGHPSGRPVLPSMKLREQSRFCRQGAGFFSENPGTLGIKKLIFLARALPSGEKKTFLKAPRPGVAPAAGPCIKARFPEGRQACHVPPSERRSRGPLLGRALPGQAKIRLRNNKTGQRGSPPVGSVSDRTEAKRVSP